MPVSTRMALPNKGWSLPQAAHILSQGYTEKHVEAITGFDARIVRNYEGKADKP